jgi:predicted transcriptional regulator
MTTAKETMVEIIARQPDDISYDALRELACARMVQSGLDDFVEGRTVSNEDAKNAIDSWQR